MTLGIKLNNPGNIERTADAWEGMSQEQPHSRFVAFDTPEAGLRAMALLLDNYQTKYGLTDVASIISKYAPKNENNTAKYIKFVQKSVGTSLVDLSDDETMLGLMDAVIRMEQGQNPYSEDQIRVGIRAARGEKLPPAAAAEQAAPASEPAVISEQTYSMVSPFGTKKGPVSSSDLRQAQPVTAGELEAAQKESDANRPRFVEGTALAVSQEWSLLWALRGREGHAPDPSFVMTPEMHKELTKDVPEQYWSYFDGAHSQDHANSLRDAMLKDLEIERKLASMGYTGTALRLGAAIFDPAAVGLSILTEGAALPFVAGVKATRVGRIATNAILAGTSNLAVEALIGANKPTHDTMDYLYSFGGGMVMGSVFGALGRNPATKSEAHQLEIAAKSMMDSIEAKHANDAGLPEPDHLKHASSAEASFREPLRHDTFDIVRDAGGAPTSVAPRLRFDSVGELKSSENGFVRLLGGSLAEDAVGNADRSTVTAFGASETQQLLSRRMDTAWSQVRETSYHEWADAQGLNWLGRQKSRGAFYDQVADYVRNTDPTVEFHQAVKRLGDQYRRLVDDYRKLANEPGLIDGKTLRPVKGFGGIEADANYVTRAHDERKLLNLVSSYGDKNIRELIKGAIRAAQPKIDADVAAKMAKAYLRRVREVNADIDGSVSRAFNGEDTDFLLKVLREETDMDEGQLQGIANLFKDKGDGAHSRGKKRMLMDENFKMKLSTKDGRSTNVVSIKDMLVNDIDQLFAMYNRQMSGAVALARLRIENPKAPGEFLVDGITSRGEFDTLLKQVRAAADELGMKGSAVDRDVANLEFLYKSIAGVPHEWAGTKGAQLIRMVRDYNFIRVMNQVGFAQIAEIGNIIGQLGMKAAFANMPSLRAFKRMAKTGQISDELSREIEGVFGIGADRLRGTVSNRWDDFGGTGITAESRALHQVDQVLARGKRITADISGMAAVNTALHRWTMRAVVQKFTDIAFKPTQANMNRMRSLGLSQEMLMRVGEQLKKHSSFETGMITGKKIRQMNLQKWDDLEAAADFQLAVSRWSRRIIQENDIGMMHRWMSNPLAHMMLQFRSFMMGAWTKQFLHNIHMRDAETLAAFTTSMFVSSVVYMTQTHLQALGRSDREEFLKKRLSAKQISLAAFNRAGFSTLFPMMIDTGMRAAGQDPLFDFRTTGLPSNTVFGNPTVSLIDNATSGIAGLVRPIIDGRAQSQQELRSLYQLAPFQNFIPLQSTFNALIADQPLRTPKNTN